MYGMFGMTDAEFAEAMDPALAQQNHRCPRCHAAPGEPCVLRQRTGDPVHAPRSSAQFNSVRRRVRKAAP